MSHQWSSDKHSLLYLSQAASGTRESCAFWQNLVIATGRYALSVSPYRCLGCGCRPLPQPPSLPQHHYMVATQDVQQIRYIDPFITSGISPPSSSTFIGITTKVILLVMGPFPPQPDPAEEKKLAPSPLSGRRAHTARLTTSPVKVRKKQTHG